MKSEEEKAADAAAKRTGVEGAWESAKEHGKNLKDSMKADL